MFAQNHTPAIENILDLFVPTICRTILFFGNQEGEEVLNKALECLTTLLNNICCETKTTSQQAISEIARNFGLDPNIIKTAIPLASKNPDIKEAIPNLKDLLNARIELYKDQLPILADRQQKYKLNPDRYPIPSEAIYLSEPRWSSSGDLQILVKGKDDINYFYQLPQGL